MQQLWILCLILVLAGCAEHRGSSVPISPVDSVRIVNEILAHRAQVDSTFRNDPDSPFNRDSTIHYEGIKWYPPDVRFHFVSRLIRYEHADTVVVLGTKGEERQQLRYGYFLLPFEGKEYRLNVYKFTPSDSRRYALYRNHLSVWFTDSTTGEETYGVGRYLEVGKEDPDPDHRYTLDFNYAYNPYCAYSVLYSCAIPTKDDHLPFAITAGELKYHH
jgi:uncharacterized protein (DUF1684 family)